MPALPALPEPVAAELKRHKFPTAAAKEAMAARLLAVWKMIMQRGANNAYLMPGRQRHRRARR
jgi:hypothetical protein